jgi:hypothetical protein
LLIRRNDCFRDWKSAHWRRSAHSESVLTCGEVSDIAQGVQDCDQTQTQWRRAFDCSNGIFDFAHDVESVLITLIRESDVYQGVCQVETIGCGPSERVAEVGGWIDDTSSSTEDDEARDGYTGGQSTEDRTTRQLTTPESKP